MAIAKLSIDLEARLANLQAGLDKAGFLAERQAQRIEASFARLKGIASGLGTGLAAAFTVPALATFITRTIDGVDALNDLADATGDSIENLSALEDIALRTGTSMETAGDAVVKLNNAIFDANRDPNSTAAKAIQGLGLSVKDLMALSPVERLQEVGKALNQFGGENKLEYNIALLGKSARETAPLLKDLAEAGKLVGTVTTEQAEEAEKFNKQLFAMQKNATDLARTLAGPLVTSLNRAIEKIRNAKGAWETLKAVDASAGILMMGGGEESTGGATGSWGEPDKPKLPALPGNDTAKKSATRAAASEFDKYTAALIAAQVATLNLSAEEQARYDIANNKLGKLTAAQQQQVLDLARGVDIMKGKYGELESAQEAFRRSELAATEATNAAMLAAQQSLDAQIDAFSGRTADALKLAQTTRLEARINAGEVFSAEELDRITRGIAGIGDEMDRIAETGREVGDELALVFTSAAGDAITHWQGVSALLKGILQDLAQLALRQTVMQPLGKALSGALGGGGGIGGFLESLDLGKFLGVSFAAGGAFDGSIRKFAAGDVFGSPTLFRYGGGRMGMMGEAGPEAVMPLKRGADGKLGVAGGQTINVAINVAAGASADDWRRSQRQITSDLQRSLRRAGAIA